MKRGKFSSCTRSTADCRHVSLTPLHSNSCSRCRVSTLHTHAIGATAGDLPAQLHASYTANAKWQLAGSTTLLGPLVIINRRTRTNGNYRSAGERGWSVLTFIEGGWLKIARYPAIFFFTVDYLGNNSLLDPSRFKRNTLFFFF